MPRPVAMLFTLVAMMIAQVVGAGGGMLCLGGGHAYACATPTAGGLCDHVCGHGEGWPIPTPADHHGDHHSSRCGCTDVSLADAQLATLPRDDVASTVPLFDSPSAGLAIACIETGLGRRGPPVPPPWFNPAAGQHLVCMTSTRLHL